MIIIKYFILKVAKAFLHYNFRYSLQNLNFNFLKLKSSLIFKKFKKII